METLGLGRELELDITTALVGGLPASKRFSSPVILRDDGSAFEDSQENVELCHGKVAK